MAATGTPIGGRPLHQSARLLVVGAAAALVLTSCGIVGQTDPEPEVDTVVMRLNPSQVAVAVAQDQGCFDERNLNVDYTQVGYGESAALFLAGDDPVGAESPHEIAEWVSQGEDVLYFSNAAGLNFWNGVLVREEDADKYQSIEDLVGEPFGHPGFGTGTWAAFEIIAADRYGINAREDFELVTADPGALMGLLETGEIEAAVNFAGQAATAMAGDDFELIFSFSEEWIEGYGQPLVINGFIARRDWLMDNLDVARRLEEGTDCGLQWMKDNIEEFNEDGRYADWVRAEGWFSSPETTEFIQQLLLDGDWYLTSDYYTHEWIDAVYEFILRGEGVFADEVPDKWDIFLNPDELD